MQTSVGVIGVGELGRAIVEGLCGLDDPPQIWLSPRGTTASTDLARRFSGVAACASNHEVSERADVLLLTVRPDSLTEAVGDLAVSPDTLVISAVAGATHDRLRDLLGDACTIVRAVPMPAVRTRRSVTALFPADDRATGFFDSLGGSVAADGEAEFAALMASTATVSTFMQYVSTIVDWLTDQGIDSSQAERYVRGFIQDASTEFADHDRSLRELAQDHETAGGLNEQLRRGWFDPASADLKRGLDALAARAAGRPASAG